MVSFPDNVKYALLVVEETALAAGEATCNMRAQGHVVVHWHLGQHLEQLSLN